MRFLVPMWTPRPQETIDALETASIGVLERAAASPIQRRNRLAAREVQAVVEAASPMAALARTRAAVADLAATAGVEAVRLVEDPGRGPPVADVSPPGPTG